MSHGPSTLGIMITSSLSPISVTSWVRSSSTQGLSSALTRVQSCVSPKSTAFPTSISPSRAGIFLSTGTASSRLPSRTSACLAMSGTFARIFSLEASKKWIIRDGLTGISRSGSGASMASGWKKSLGFLTASFLGLGGAQTSYSVVSGAWASAFAKRGRARRNGSCRCMRGCSESPATCHRAGVRSARAALVAEDGDGLIGLCTAYLELNSVRFGQRCWVEDLAVDPRRRSQGVGGRLLDAAADWARGRGATHIELDTGLARTDAQRFYERREPDAVGYSYSWRL